MNRQLVLRFLGGRLSALRLLLTAAFLLRSSLITQAQTNDTLRGPIRDANGAVLPGATLTRDVVPPGFALWDFYGAQRLYAGLELFGAVDSFTDSRDPMCHRR